MTVSRACQALAASQQGVSDTNDRGRIDPSAQLCQNGFRGDDAPPDSFTEDAPKVFFIVAVGSMTEWFAPGLGPNTC